MNINMNQNIVKGKTIYFTGYLGLWPQYRAEQLGATIAKSISEDVDWVVVGPGYSPTSLQQAQNFGIKVLDEKRFFQLVDPDAWIEHEKAVAARKEERERWAAENEKRRVEAERALEIKRATMPRVRTKARIVTDYGWGRGPARLIKEEDFWNLTAQQLREAICNGEHASLVGRAEDGVFVLLCTNEQHIDFCPRRAEILLYDDGSFDVVELEEYKDGYEDE